MKNDNISHSWKKISIKQIAVLKEAATVLHAWGLLSKKHAFQISNKIKELTGNKHS